MAFEQYKGRCIGTLLKYLYEYTPKADTFIFENGKVHNDRNQKDLVATYFWMNDADVPIFKFTKKYKYLYRAQSRDIHLIIGIEIYFTFGYDAYIKYINK